MTTAERQEWVARRKDYIVQGRCANCGGLPHDVHEILAGANRQAAFVEPACWLRLCRTCHDELQGADIEYQLAIKLMADPANFSLVSFCRAWNRPVSALDTALICTWVAMLSRVNDAGE